MSYKYNPYRDEFEHIQDENPISAYGTAPSNADALRVYTYPITYIADECIEKIADEVVRKLKNTQESEVDDGKTQEQIHD